MGLDSKMSDIAAELELRLAGIKAEDGTDDQLIENAKALEQSAFQKYMWMLVCSKVTALIFHKRKHSNLVYPWNRNGDENQLILMMTSLAVAVVI